MNGRLNNVSYDEGLAIITPLIEALKSMESIESIILFGSLAKNTMTEASDIDLAIIAENDSNLTALREEIRRLKRTTVSWPMDLVILKKDWFESRKDLGGVCLEIHTDGQCLYSKNKKKESA